MKETLKRMQDRNKNVIKVNKRKGYESILFLRRRTEEEEEFDAETMQSP